MDTTPELSPWIRMRVVQTRTMVLGSAVVVAALFLDLALLEITAPIASGESAAPVTTAPAATVLPFAGGAGVPVTTAPVTTAPVTEAPLTTRVTSAPLPTAAPPTVALTNPPATSAATATQPAAPVPAAPLAAPGGIANTPAPAPAPQPVTPATPSPTPSPTPVPTTLAPTTVATTTPATTTQAPVAVEFRTYGVNDVGSVVLAYTGSSITLASTDLGDGWVYEAESNGPRTVQLKFFNTQTADEAEWKAAIESGRIQIED